jgi:hypothetical protein
MFSMAILDQRVPPRRAEAAPERREFPGAKVLLAEHQHRMLGKRMRDPIEFRFIERLRQIDAECLGSQRLAQRAKLWCVAHGDPPGWSPVVGL